MLTLGHFPGIEVSQVEGQIDVMSDGNLKIVWGIISAVSKVGSSVSTKCSEVITDIISIDDLKEFCFNNGIPWIEIWDLQAKAYLDLMQD